MNEESISIPIERYIAIDAHKHYLMVGGMNARQEVVLPTRRVEMENYPKWAKANLRPGDAVVIEATTNTWTLYDVTLPCVSKVVVAHPLEVKQIAKARVKTDKHDVNCLARLLGADLIPEVWVPPLEVRELRTLIAHRRRLVKMRAMTYNRLHSVVHRNNLVPPEGGFFADKNRSWWENLTLSPVEKLQTRQNLAMLDRLESLIAEVDQELARLSTTAPWSEHTPYLLQLPGFGVVISMTVLSAIGDITRFESAKKLVGCAGLGAGVHDSGKEHIEKRITKSGRKELRWALVEAAWRAIRISPYWKEQYEKYLHRMRKPNLAIVAIARKLLVAVWQVMTKEETDIHASEEDLAYKMLVLAWDLGENERMGLTYKQFAKYALMKLGIQTDITRFVRRNVPRRLAPREEVLARMTELGLTV